MPCEIVHAMVLGTSANSSLILKTINLFLPCELIFWKSYQSWQPSKFFKAHISHVSQLWGIPQPQYFITLLLDLHWIYFWKHYIYYEKDTKVGSQNIGYQICFCNQTDYGRGLLIFLFFMPLWLSVKFRFPGISQKMLWGNGLKFCMLMYPDHLQNHCF